MRALGLDLVGFGNVGRALAALLIARSAEAPFKVVSIVTAHHGWWVDAQGIDLSEALSAKDLPSKDPRPPIADLPGDVLVELTTLDPRTGQPAYDHIAEALRAKKHVVTANKGPIAHRYDELTELAAAAGRMLRFEATVADCLPVFDLRRSALPLAEIRRIRGIVSSTTNHILSSAARGVRFEDALTEAQRLGVAETDPTSDLEGWDAAAKATILANVLMGARIGIDDVSREIVDGSTSRDAERVAHEGARLRPLIEIAQHGGKVMASFGPRRLDPLDPLFAVDGLSMALELETDLAGRVVVQLHDPHIEQVAYAVLTDLLEVAAAG
ncbi:MAG TPA: homoserine dehydrogenase [Candidatus Limnocylindria bacterium]